jgi:hypothetical protein
MKRLYRYFLKSRMNHWFDRMNHYGQNALDSSTLGGYLYWRGQRDQAATNLAIVKAKWKAMQ